MAGAFRTSFRGTVEVEGSQVVKDLAKALGERAYDTAPLMELMAEPLTAAVRDYANMRSWAPLAESTIERKASQGRSIEILRDETRPIAGYPTRTPDSLWDKLQTGGDTIRMTRTTVTLSMARGGKRFYAYFVQNDKRATYRRLMAIPEQGAAEMVALTGAWLTAPIREMAVEEGGDGE